MDVTKGLSLRNIVEFGFRQNMVDTEIGFCQKWIPKGPILF